MAGFFPLVLRMDGGKLHGRFEEGRVEYEGARRGQFPTDFERTSLSSILYTLFLHLTTSIYPTPLSLSSNSGKPKRKEITTKVIVFSRHQSSTAGESGSTRMDQLLVGGFSRVLLKKKRLERRRGARFDLVNVVMIT